MERRTCQRRAIRAVLEQAKRPLTPHEILDRAQRDIEGLGIATVYRNLKAFEENGWLERVELPNEPTRYERADLGHHHHFHCRDCHRVFDIPGCAVDFHLAVSREYEVTSHELILYGTCPECRT